MNDLKLKEFFRYLKVPTLISKQAELYSEEARYRVYDIFEGKKELKVEQVNGEALRILEDVLGHLISHTKPCIKLEVRKTYTENFIVPSFIIPSFDVVLLYDNEANMLSLNVEHSPLRSYKFYLDLEIAKVYQKVLKKAQYSKKYKVLIFPISFGEVEFVDENGFSHIKGDGNDFLMDNYGGLCINVEENNPFRNETDYLYNAARLETSVPIISSLTSFISGKFPLEDFRRTLAYAVYNKHASTYFDIFLSLFLEVVFLKRKDDLDWLEEDMRLLDNLKEVHDFRTYNSPFVQDAGADVVINFMKAICANRYHSILNPTFEYMKNLSLFHNLILGDFDNLRNLTRLLGEKEADRIAENIQDLQMSLYWERKLRKYHKVSEDGKELNYLLYKKLG